MSDSNIITYTQREAVYVQGELAFKEGQPRADNPYAASSPTLEQIWWNGWDHGRRKKRRQRTPLDERDLRTRPGVRL
jgi:hypothetical protein